MTFEEIEQAAAPPPEESIVQTEDEEAKKKRKFKTKRFVVKLSLEQIDQVKLMDPVGRRVYVFGKMRVNKKGMTEEGLYDLPVGVVDAHLDYIIDAIVDGVGL